MTCTTFLNESELNVPTSNRHINELLTEVRRESGEDWQIIERSYVVKTLFRKQQNKKFYEIYKHVGGCGDWQIINFYKEDSASSINFGISADVVMAYMFGLLGSKKCNN